MKPEATFGPSSGPGRVLPGPYDRLARGAFGDRFPDPIAVEWEQSTYEAVEAIRFFPTDLKMNKVARTLGSPVAFCAGVLFAVAVIGIGIEFGWRSSVFQVARALMTSATAVGLVVVLWSRADGPPGIGHATSKGSRANSRSGLSPPIRRCIVTEKARESRRNHSGSAGPRTVHRTKEPARKPGDIARLNASALRGILVQSPHGSGGRLRDLVVQPSEEGAAEVRTLVVRCDRHDVRIDAASLMQRTPQRDPGRLGRARRSAGFRPTERRTARASRAS